MINNRRIAAPLAIALAALFAAGGGGCETFTAASGVPIESEPKALEGRYITLTPQQIKDMLPAPTTQGAGFEFEASLTKWTTQINDGGKLKAWSEESIDDTPYDLLGVLDPTRKNADGSPVHGEEWKALYPRTCELLAAAVKDLKDLKYKNAYPRQRPDSSGDDAYPSGHTSRASVQAAVLAQVVPGKFRELIKEALAHGMHRVVLNKHYPTDVWAGFVFGQQIGLRMGEAERFKADLALAQAEWQSQAGN